ncbi:hypothetical protein [Pontibacter actiniarum]|uniref:DUF3311 domain-containing protein n=1 Tax=Pontibacter actiniarum TaxID=323450 RepID=A0A1X9YM60_9BACT|nr:hypothetical protein [Pontibacter actiniarum]ARS33960.1 hypothetical protein CA264_00085 [Pontibacter actiniarum]
MRDRVKGRRLFFISVLFLLLLNFPVLSIFNKGGVVAGVPVLYLYLMLGWLGCIVAIGLFVERKRIRKPKQRA